MKLTRILILFFVVALSSQLVNAQVVKDSGNTSMSSDKRKDKDHKNKRILHWIKNNSKGLLIGNACMDEVTHRMGFEYVVQIKGQARNRNGFSRNMHNLGVKTGILFRNGPFWKFKLKKKRKECRRLTGDHLG